MKLISILFFVFWSAFANGQLFESKIFYPDVASYKTKYYNGSGGRGFYSITILDKKGRKKEEQHFHKQKWNYTEFFKYNEQNDIIQSIYKNGQRIDTTNYVYQYNDLGQIISQKNHFHQLILTETDQPNVKIIRQIPASSFMMEVKFNKNQQILVKKDTFYSRLHTGTTAHLSTTKYTYHQTGLVASRVITYDPPLKKENQPVYVGRPGSDNMTFEYKYDKTGKKTRSYSVIDEKKYLTAKYKYKKR